MSLQGTVKRFNPTKGFGFITGNDGTDVFLHLKSCTDGGVPREGDVVSYDMTESPIKPGQMQAGNVSGGSGKGGGGGAHHGSCKSFNAEKGFGFIVGADGSDIFFHVKGMADGTTPQAGDALSYDLEPSRLKPDQLQAQNITGGTGFDAKGGGKGGGKGDAWGGKGGGDAWGGKGGWGGGDAWGGKGDAWGGKGGGDAWGGKGGGDAWGGKGGWGGGDAWGGKGGGDAWGGKGGGDAWGGKGAGPYGGGKGKW